MKIVMVVNNELPAGLCLNTAAVLGISLGRYNKEITGKNCFDKTGTIHKGITNKPVPVLSACGETLKKIYKNSITNKNLSVIDFSQTAQKSLDYNDYETKLSKMETSEIELSGLCISGPEKDVSSLTGSLKLYR